MKTFVFFLIALFLISCGNQKMRFSRIRSKAQIVVVVDGPEKERHEIKIRETIEVSEASTIETTRTVDSKEVEAVQKTIVPISHDEAQQESSNITRVNSEKEKVTEALEAERNSRKAMVWLIASFFGFFLLLLPGLIFFFIGAHRYIQAKSSQYNTEKGVETLRVARVFFVIDFILTVAFIVATLALAFNTF